MAYDISELVNANPWNEESEISALPVYQNLLHYDEHLHASGADYGKMREFILDVAGRLGLDPSNLTVTDNAPSEEEKQHKELAKLRMQVELLRNFLFEAGRR